MSEDRNADRPSPAASRTRRATRVESSLVLRNAALLEQGAALVRTLGDAAYASRDASGVGSHVRHVLDFYDCFFRGLPGRRIDYDARSRDAETETVRAVALRRLGEAAASLLALAEAAPSGTLRVQSDAPGEDDGPWGESSVTRELQFLLSHTMHHFALVRLLLSDVPVEVPADFGIAPSTLAHRERLGGLLH